MMGVAGILGGALLSAIHGATVINTIYQDARAYTTFVLSHQVNQNKLIQYLQLIVFGLRYLVYHWISI